jgi:hypothetical protein
MATTKLQILRYSSGGHKTWEWTDNRQALVVYHRLPAIHTQPGTNLPTLFTAVAAYYKNFLDPVRKD